jgi:hypothetical protein
MLMVTTWKNKHYYVVFLDFIKDIHFCDKYVDVIWRCAYTFGPPSYLLY